jgi:hypothetical protein
VKTRSRFASPTTVIALVALFFALGGSAFAVGQHVQSPFAAQPRCTTGSVRGIAYVTGPSGAGMANTPDSFSSAGALFGRKFNCTGRATQVRRVGTGMYEVRFVGISGASAVASATGDAYADVEPAAGGVFKVTVHPAGRDDKVDSPFTIVVV